ncbi:prolyl oligopeptidase family protein [Carboxylicivirga sp. M1479]|uniref:prolyl oligopeptidase family serine peptidase n=1 Tax=Carboxylicivirga sp. M1479 TaxID=2594476 RepID=UPI0011782644|nr:prolyl oligopeptidase family serine peptidase [Carboxylicivirga sp. M1479]TRX71382.1 S9 family peptidase [Carboxylicivirga sp. M1479]
MKTHLSVLLILLLIMTACNCNKSTFDYPETKKGEVVDTYFGTQVEDPYRWLEDDRSEETALWVKQQNKLTNSHLASIPFRDKIKNRLTEIWNYPRTSAPFKAGDNYFFSKNDGLQNQSVYYIQESLESEAQVFLDPNTLSEDGTVSLTNFSVSNDGKYLGYGISRGGSDWREFFIKDIKSGELLKDHLQWIKFSGIAWYKDGFFYNRYPTPLKGDELKGENTNSKLYYHKVGTSQDKDVLIYEDTQNPEWSFSANVTEDEKFLIISVTESTSGNALYFKNLEDDSEIVKVIKSFNKDYSIIDHVNGKLWIYTNDMAPKYQVLAIDPASPDRDNWTTIIPEHASNVLVNTSIVGHKVFANYQQDAHSAIKVFSMTGESLYDVELPSVGTVSGFYGKSDAKETFFTFSSYTYPSVVFRYNIADNKSTVFSQTDIDFAIDQYETKQIKYKSKDGTEVPMFIVHKKGIELNGKNPTWLYGYGGFNISLNPRFDIRRLLWLENGGVFAVANIRGGGEYGEEWHKAGTLTNKQNVFDDFISAGHYLIDNGYTKPKYLAIQGGSNGGLLVGAVINQTPDLFKVAIPQVGVMDMLRYQHFTIGRYWATDYGTSEDSPEMFQYLYKYSPIHNIKKHLNYPAVMVTTADHDDRVVPAHSFKYIATLQNTYKGQQPMLIRIETDAGHGAGTPTSKTIEEWTDLYSFTFKQMGIEPIY